MRAEELRERIRELSVWQRGDERSPSKPLLLLWALGRFRAGASRHTEYEQLEPALISLLEEFGPSRQSYRANYPFWYTRTDEVWEVAGYSDAMVRERRSKEPSSKQLRDAQASGGFTSEVWDLLEQNPDLVGELASDLLADHFPDTLHADILAAVGLEDLQVVQRRIRDPNFRREVLRAYGFACAVCGFDARIDHQPIGIEAAHIKWHQARGPDEIRNGLALCSLHHKIFDRGGMTIGDQGRVEVSPLINGGDATEQLLWRFHERSIRLPRSGSDYPAEEFLDWHRREVWRAS